MAASAVSSSLTQLIHATAQPTPKFDGWNCRDWVMEVVKEILVPNGWADAGIVTQQSLLPLLKVAAPATVKAREENKLDTPHMVSFQLQVSQLLQYESPAANVNVQGLSAVAARGGDTALFYACSYRMITLRFIQRFWFSKRS